MASKQTDETTDEVTQDDIEEVEETVEEAEGEESPSLDDEITPAIMEEVDGDHSALLASLEADLEFLHGDNMSFYQANKAYYEDRNYEEAITEFQASIEYEKSHPPFLSDVEESENAENPPDPDPPNDILCKSFYWMGEAYIKLDQIDQAVEAFGQLSDHYNLHYIAPAAQRRIASLMPDEESESA